MHSHEPSTLKAITQVMVLLLGGITETYLMMVTLTTMQIILDTTIDMIGKKPSHFFYANDQVEAQPQLGSIASQFQQVLFILTEVISRAILKLISRRSPELRRAKSRTIIK